MKKRAPVAAAPRIKTELRLVPVVTAASLHSMARKIQEDVSFLLMPLVLEWCVDVARKGSMGAMLRMDQLLRALGGEWDVNAVAIGETVCAELRKRGIAAQVAKMDDDRHWERLVLQVSWKEVAS